MTRLLTVMIQPLSLEDIIAVRIVRDTLQQYDHMIR